MSYNTQRLREHVYFVSLSLFLFFRTVIHVDTPGAQNANRKAPTLAMNVGAFLLLAYVDQLNHVVVEDRILRVVL